MDLGFSRLSIFGPRLSTLISRPLASHFKTIKLNKSLKSLWSQCYQHLHHCHHYHYHYHIQQQFTCSNLTIETLWKGVNLFKVNNKDTRTTLLTTGKCPLQLKPFQRLFSLVYSSFFRKRFVLSKTFMELLMKNKRKVMDNYLFDLKFTDWIKNVTSCCIDLHYLLYYRYDLHCSMSGDWSCDWCFKILSTFASFSILSNRL